MGKVKVVEIENDVPAPEAPEVASLPEEPTTQPDEQVEETPIEVSKPVTEDKKPEPQKKQMEYVTCDVCNKSMLTKTYKYSHQKLCKPAAPPPPPPTPEPKPKRTSKPKEVPKDKPVEVYHDNSKPVWDGKVSFNSASSTPPPPNPVDIYRAAREQRQQVKIQRVKSLISQAI